jgi:toxin FitB
VYLLDTNVISELRKAKPHGAVVAWLQQVREVDLRIPAVAIGEIQAGIERTREHDGGKAGELEVWLSKIIAGFEVLPMDGQAFQVSARLMHRKPSHLSEDAMIAAIAIRFSLTVVTRNTKDFKPFGVSTLNPFLTPK